MNKYVIVVSQRDPQPFLTCGFLKFSGEGTYTSVWWWF